MVNQYSNYPKRQKSWWKQVSQTTKNRRFMKLLSSRVRYVLPVPSHCSFNLISDVQLKFNKWLKAGTVLENKNNILKLILRLRQACLHPSLVTHKDAVLVEAAMNEKLNSKVPKKNFSREVLERIAGTHSHLQVEHDYILPPDPYTPIDIQTSIQADTHTC